MIIGLTKPGNYNVTLFVKDGDGDRGTFVVSINISQPEKEEPVPIDTDADLSWLWMLLILIIVVFLVIIILIYVTQSKKLRKFDRATGDSKDGSGTDIGGAVGSEFTTAGKLDFVISGRSSFYHYGSAASGPWEVL